MNVRWLVVLVVLVDLLERICDRRCLVVSDPATLPVDQVDQTFSSCFLAPCSLMGFV